MKRLKIDLADRSYEILVGRNLLGRTGEFLTPLVKSSRAVVVSHPSINVLYGNPVVTSLQQSGYQTRVFEIPQGETHKNLQEAETLYDRLIEFNCDRRSLLVALGGGVIGDLTGFVAATYLRGVPYIQVPTTLLSQVDSSVGGKTAVNHAKGKNLIGAFYQPRVVVIDLDTLRSLPADEFKAGLAEIIKYGVISDPDLFSFLEKNAEKVLAQDTDVLQHIIEVSCSIKAGVVERDETESEYRMVLNFGHTLGHAVEALTAYSKYKHGEAVAIGMVYAAKLSRELGKCSDSVVSRITALVEKLGLPSKVPDLAADDLIEAMYLDKKARDKKIKFVLVRELGEVEFFDNVPEEALKKVLSS